MSNRNVTQKYSKINSVTIINIIIFVTMFGAPIMSSMMYSFSNFRTQLFFYLGYAQNEGDRRTISNGL